jgi:hypothetical protein
MAGLLMLTAVVFGQEATFRARYELVEKIWTFLTRPASTVTYTLGNATTDDQGTAVVDLSIATSRLAPSGIQWDLGYLPADVASVSVAAGPVATAASKEVACNPLGPGSLRCIVSGLNTNVMANGVATTITVKTRPESTAGTTTLALSGLATTNRFGNPLNSAIAPGGGVVTFRILLSDLTCPQTDIETGEQVTCTVSLNRVVTLDTVVQILYDDAHLTGPASVTIPAGQKTAEVTVTGH